MTIPEDDESLERELFARRERALAAPPVPRLEDVLRAASPPRRVVRAFGRRGAPASLFAFAACAASVALIAPRLHLFAAASPDATIRPDPVVTSVTSVSPVAAMSEVEEDDSPACSLAARPRSLVSSTSSSEGLVSSSCSLSCATDSP